MTKLLVICLFVLVAVAQCGRLTDLAAGLRAELNEAHATWQWVQKSARSSGLSDLSVDCALCGVAVNEIEGLLAENITETEMTKILEQDICSRLKGTAGFLCDEAATFLPSAVALLEKKYTVSAVCIEVGLCAKPFTPHADPVRVPTYAIDLDKAPVDRMTEVCKQPAYQKLAQFLVGTVDAILPGGGASVSEIGEVLNDFYLPKEYAQEIAGCAAAIGVSKGWMTLFNLGYELSDACTSIVAQADDGTVMHGRNMDFWSGMGFTDSLKDMTFIADYRTNNKTKFYSTTFPGFAGCLSCQRPKAFSVTVDTRFYPQGLGDFFYEIVAAIEERNASLTTFLVREAIENEASYAKAVEALSDGELIDDVYYIVAGVAPGEGTVLSRNRTAAVNTWTLDAPSRWYEVETNYDHWEQPPWFDDRRYPAIYHMDAMGRGALTPDSLMKIMSMKPTLNLQTTYTIISVPKEGLWQSYSRWCPFPCTQ